VGVVVHSAPCRQKTHYLSCSTTACGRPTDCPSGRSVYHVGGVGDAGSVERDVRERGTRNRLSVGVDCCCRGCWGLLGEHLGIGREHRFEMESESSLEGVVVATNHVLRSCQTTETPAPAAASIPDLITPLFRSPLLLPPYSEILLKCCCYQETSGCCLPILLITTTASSVPENTNQFI